MTVNCFLPQNIILITNEAARRKQRDILLSCQPRMPCIRWGSLQGKHRADS